MASSDVERQRKHREKKRGLNLARVNVWVPNDRVVEIKAIAMRMTEKDLKIGNQAKDRWILLNFSVARKALKFLRSSFQAQKSLLNG
jgi:hypothetical protein